MKRSSITHTQFRRIIDKTKGNLTRAAVLLKICKVHAIRLAKKFDLREYAKKLRIETTGVATGRPRKHKKVVQESLVSSASPSTKPLCSSTSSVSSSIEALCSPSSTVVSS